MTAPCHPGACRCPLPVGGRRGPPLRVFLSHTSDLREHPADRSFVAAAEGAVIRAGHAVTDMAYLAARDTSPVDCCRSLVSGADVYVGIVGGRYGSDVRGPLRLSYTELEFEVATALRLPRLVFLLREGADSAVPGRQSVEHGARQEAFRRRLLESGVTVAWAASPVQLELEVYQALVELMQRRGSACGQAGESCARPRHRERAAASHSRRGVPICRR
jgi:Domain of unknown function (DUF4062)